MNEVYQRKDWLWKCPSKGLNDNFSLFDMVEISWCHCCHFQQALISTLFAFPTCISWYSILAFFPPPPPPNLPKKKKKKTWCCLYCLRQMINGYFIKPIIWVNSIGFSCFFHYSTLCLSREHCHTRNASSSQLLHFVVAHHCCWQNHSPCFNHS